MKIIDQYLHRPLLLLRLALRVRFICGSWGIIRYFRCDSSRISWLFRRGREVGLARPNLWLCGREELCGGRAPCQRRPRPPPPVDLIYLVRSVSTDHSRSPAASHCAKRNYTMGGKASWQRVRMPCRAAVPMDQSLVPRARCTDAVVCPGFSIRRLVLQLQVDRQQTVRHGVRGCCRSRTPIFYPSERGNASYHPIERPANNHV